ncbi:MAG: hypothetical protein AAFR96_08950 [Planctomycetota bacterium]
MADQHDMSAAESDRWSKPKSGRGKFIAVGCLSVVLVVLFSLAVGTAVVISNWPAIEARLKAFASGEVTELMANGIRDTDLTPEQKEQLVARIEVMGDEFEEGTLTLDDLTKIGEMLETSPLLAVGIVSAMNKVYIEPSELTREEQSAAMRLNDRLARGIFEKRIDPSELEPVLEPLSNPDGVQVSSSSGSEGRVGSFRINDLKDPDTITAGELRQYMANAASLLEQKSIADEPFEIDVVEEFDKLIESAIGRRIVPADSAQQDPGLPGGG